MSKTRPARSDSHQAIRDLAVQLTLIAILVLIWAWLVDTRRVSAIVVPAPLEVGRALWIALTSDWLSRHVAATLVEALAALMIATVAGVTCALLMTRSRLVKRVVYPYVVGFQVIPKVALAPLFVIIFGFGLESKIAVAFTLAFFPILIGTIAGIEGVPRGSLALMRSLRASSLQTFFALTLRSGLPSVFAGLKTGATLALIGAIVAEYVTAREGIGRLLILYSINVQPDFVWALVVITGALGMLVYGSMSLLERRVVWWQQ